MSKIFGAGVVVTQLALFGAVVYGYCHNIYSLVSHTGEFALLEGVRAAGILFPPVGVVMGYVG